MRTLGLVMCLMLAVAWAPDTVAAAGNAACSSPGYRFGGADHLQGGVVSAEFKFDKITPLLCSSNPGYDSGSATWTSVAWGGKSLYQVGAVKCVNNPGTACDGTYNLFYAWGRDNDSPGCEGLQELGPTGRYLGELPSTSINTFTVRRTTTQIQFLVNGTVKTTIGVGNICWTSLGVEYKAETWDIGDQMGGVVADKQNFTNALMQVVVNGPWISPGLTSCYTTQSPYFCTRLNGQTINVWTDRS